jgi:hypothetical protein
MELRGMETSGLAIGRLKSLSESGFVGLVSLALRSYEPGGFALCPLLLYSPSLERRAMGRAASSYAASLFVTLLPCPLSPCCLADYGPCDFVTLPPCSLPRGYWGVRFFGR